jgi:hypothetical protein
VDPVHPEGRVFIINHIIVYDYFGSYTNKKEKRKKKSVMYPQAQIRVFKVLKKIETETQFILTTHCATIASNISLENLILSYGQQNGANVFSLQKVQTGLEADDYDFLYRFFDVTKAIYFLLWSPRLVQDSTRTE